MQLRLQKMQRNHLRLLFPFSIFFRATQIQAILASQLVTLAPDQSLPALKLRYLQSKEINFTSQIILHTNVSSFQAPLHIFSGDLKVQFIKDEKCIVSDSKV